MRKVLATITLILVVFTTIGAATIEQAHLVLDTNASVSANSKTLIAQSGDDYLVAYQANDATIRLGRLTGGEWESKSIRISGSPILQAFTAQGPVVVIGYKDGGAIYTLSSTDGGRTFQSPALIAQSSHRADIHDIAIDRRGKIHLVFHRHDRYWDNNYSYSTDQGRTWVTRNAFTRATDSSSTGYNGSLQIINDLLYTIYRDNNDGFRIKLGLSENGGSSWRISRLVETRGALALGFAVDPSDRDTLYIGLIDETRLGLYKVSGATTAAPKATLLREDRSIIHSTTSSFASIHLGVSDEGELAIIYRNPRAQAYELLVSDDGGASFSQTRLEVESAGNSWIWGADLKVWGDEPLFVRTDGKGQLVLQAFGTESGDDQEDLSFSSEEEALAALGIVTIHDPHKPFTVHFDEQTKIAMLKVKRSGPHVMINERHDQLPAMMILSNADEEDGEIHWNYDDYFQMIDRIEIVLQGGDSYLFFVTLDDEGAIGNSSTFYLKGAGETLEAPVAPSPQIMPSPVAPTRSLPISQVRAGRYSSFVLTDRGELFAAGLSDQGQLGQGSVSQISPFTSVMVYTADVATGSVHTLFLGQNGRLWVSGRNEEGQLGDGTTQRRTTPFVLTSSVKSMDGGFGHTLLVKQDGTAWAVGANTYGQLGTGDTNPRSTLTQIFEEVESVHTNWNQTSFLITVDGDLYGWGNNGEGQLGLGHTRPVLQPTYIRGNVADVAAGVSFTWILFDDGTLYSTGSNSQGQLGLAGQRSRTSFGEVAQGVTKIAAGDYTAFYIDDRAQLWATGSNQYGQWGTGSTTNTSPATGPVLVLTDVQQIAAGASHAVALKRDGSLWTTGLNTYGQLGDHTEGFRLQWRQIRGIVD